MWVRVRVWVSIRIRVSVRVRVRVTARGGITFVYALPLFASSAGLRMKTGLFQTTCRLA